MAKDRKEESQAQASDSRLQSGAEGGEVLGLQRELLERLIKAEERLSKLEADIKLCRR